LAVDWARDQLSRRLSRRAPNLKGQALGTSASKTNNVRLHFIDLSAAIDSTSPALFIIWASIVGIMSAM
jgi:hypothetical protein